MKVLKFGGTSVGSADAIRKVESILAAYVEKQKSGLIVVCSAMGGVTNELVGILALAERGNTGYKNQLDELEVRHFQAVRELMEPMNLGGVLADIKVIFNEMEDLLAGICLLQEVTAKSSDMILSFGERLSSRMLFHYLSRKSSDISLLDPLKIIRCDSRYTRNEVDMEWSQSLALEHKEKLSPITICPGFIASNEKGELVTLGRGGSDYTAALLANFYNAEVLEIWTDVDGLMTADPRIVPRAHVIHDLSYEEALELSHFGAKVIYPPSIHPAMVRDIPILIKNTFKPEAPGTRITRQYEDQAAIRGISTIKEICLLNLRGSGMVGIPRFSFRLFETLSQHHINVVMITQASSEHTICVGIESKDKEVAEQSINKTFDHEIAIGKLQPVEVEDNMSILALVGNNMKDQVGVSGQLFTVLGRNGVSIKAIAQGASERNISVVIHRRDLVKAVNVAHESFFTEEVKRINLFVVGVGHVGKALLRQIQKQQTYLVEKHLIELKVIAIANSKKCVFNTDGTGIDLSQWSTTLEQGEPQEIARFIEKMADMNLRNSVFLDVTANRKIATSYPEVLRKSIAIATPNKIAATQPQEKYDELKKLQRRYRTQYLYETNVCAGLPVISTIADLIKSGDRIHRIEAVLSGTLNFLFNTYDGSQPFSSIVRRAMDEGYAEPDPRLDLSGEDVRRKILILSRESGYHLEMEQIAYTPFVPKSCMDAPAVDVFFNELDKHEDHFKALVTKAKSSGKRIRYVAKMDNGQANTQLEFVDETHPFYHLEGSDNIVLFHTDRYAKQPLVIKGAGAGAEVTASGIFADIMRIAATN